MSLRTDDRGVSTVIGAILMFALLIAALTMVQVMAVPPANEEVEFKHNQAVQKDIRSLDSAMYTTAGVGAAQSTTIALGTQYPSRFVLFNPPPPLGRLETVDRGNITLHNVSADGDTGDYLDGTGSEEFETKAIAYHPDYNRYQNAPTTVIAPGVFYNQFDDANLTLASHLVEGRTIHLIAIEGRLAEQGLSTTVRTVPVSAPTRTVPVSDGAGNITLTIPSQLNATEWRSVLEDELSANGGHVTEISNAGPDRVNVTLESGVVYNLRMAKVGVGSNVSSPDAHYVTAVTGDNSTLSENGRTTVEFEVRDRFNAPVTGETVHLGVDKGKIVVDGTDHTGYDPADTVAVTTDEEGRAEVTYEAPAVITSTNSATIRASMAGDDLNSPPFASNSVTDATVEVKLLNSTQADQTQPLFNPPDGVVVRDPQIQTENSNCNTPGSNGDCELTFDLVNSGNQTVTLDEMRFTFYSADSQGQAPQPGSGSIELQSPGGFTSRMTYAGPFEDVEPTVTLDPGDSPLFTIWVYEDDGNTAHDIDEGDFIVLEMIIDGERKTYFIAPLDPTNP